MIDSPAPRRRWFSYSFRTFFVLLTLFCVWLGERVNRVYQQRFAVEQIQQVAGTVSYDRRVEDLYAPKWFRSFVGDDFFLQVVSVSLHYPMEGRRMRALSREELDKAINAMQRLPQLRRLSFQHT